MYSFPQVVHRSRFVAQNLSAGFLVDHLYRTLTTMVAALYGESAPAEIFPAGVDYQSWPTQVKDVSPYSKPDLVLGSLTFCRFVQRDLVTKSQAYTLLAGLRAASPVSIKPEAASSAARTTRSSAPAVPATTSVKPTAKLPPTRQAPAASVRRGKQRARSVIEEDEDDDPVIPQPPPSKKRRRVSPPPAPALSSGEDESPATVPEPSPPPARKTSTKGKSKAGPAPVVTPDTGLTILEKLGNGRVCLDDAGNFARVGATSTGAGFLSAPFQPLSAAATERMVGLLAAPVCVILSFVIHGVSS